MEAMRAVEVMRAVEAIRTVEAIGKVTPLRHWGRTSLVFQPPRARQPGAIVQIGEQHSQGQIGQAS